MQNPIQQLVYADHPSSKGKPNFNTKLVVETAKIYRQTFLFLLNMKNVSGELKL